MRLFKRLPQKVPQTVHFRLSEFASRGRMVPRKYWDNLQKLMDNLEVLRMHLGVAIRITSGWRSPSHNKAVKGARFSKHKKAMAADIKAPGYTAEEVHATISMLIRMGKMHNGGLGKYPKFTHYDVRGRRARW